MKDLITSIAALMILLSFVTIFVSGQLALENAMAVEYAAEYMETRNGDASEAKRKLADILGCEKERISILETGDGSEYEISVPAEYVLGKVLTGLDDNLEEELKNRRFTRKVSVKIEEQVADDNENSEDKAENENDEADKSGKDDNNAGNNSDESHHVNNDSENMGDNETGDNTSDDKTEVAELINEGEETHE